METRVNWYERQISVYKNVFENLEWCRSSAKYFLSGGRGLESYQKQVQEIKNLRRRYDAAASEAEKKQYKTQYKRLKEQLPCAILQGTMPKRESGKPPAFEDFTNLICIDIDNVQNAAEVRDKIFQWEYIAYCSVSVSGAGVFCIIETDGARKDERPEDAHAEYYAAAVQIFRGAGYEVDEQTKNINRFRTITFDDSARFREQPKIFNKRYTPEQKPQRKIYIPGTKYTPSSRNDLDVARILVAEIERRGIDITASYDNWCKIAAALAHTFGDGGRELFLRVSRFNSGYNERAATQKYNSFLRPSGGKNISFGTFVHLCKENGITPPKISNTPKYESKYTSQYDGVITRTRKLAEKAEKAGAHALRRNILKEIGNWNNLRDARPRSLDELLDDAQAVIIGGAGWNISEPQLEYLGK